MRSGFRFKASAIGGYERGERSISLERFWDLADLYGIPPDRLLAGALERVRPEARVEVVIDLTQLEMLPGDESRIAAELVERIRHQRGEGAGDILTLRAGDLEALALATRLPPADLVRRLEPAIRTRGEASSPS